MMKKIRLFSKQDKGSVLIAVLIILTFASVIALIVTKITITNIEMKEVESSSKRNFYGTEDVLNKIKAGISSDSAEHIKKLYSDMLGNYEKYKSSEESLSKCFQNKYLDELEADYKNIDIAGKYDVDKLKKYISESDTAEQDYLITDENAADYIVDKNEGTFTFKNISIKCKDAAGYETAIRTDITIEAPQMKNSFAPAEFMKYALIADNAVTFNASGEKINGNVYAGAGGILSELGGSGTVSADTVITRGDIVANAGTSLTIGASASSSIWAENIKTTGDSESKEDGAKVNITGNSYVSDDLSLNGKNSTVTLSGRYYGYNFQKNYDAAKPETFDAKYSSAVMINGQKSRLDMKGLTDLMISGRTFISRGTDLFADKQNEDILMGDSLSVRTNQLAYYVSKNYLDASAEYLKFTDKGLKSYIKENNLSVSEEKLKSLLDSTNQVTPYYYIDDISSETMANYYLNFDGTDAAKADKAKEFFKLYYKDNKSNVNKKAESYADNNAIIVDEDCILSLGGNILYKDAENIDGNELKQKNINIDLSESEWKNNGTFFNISSKLAVRYKALQLGLTTTHDSAKAAGARLDDKTKNPMFDYLINRAALKKLVNENTASGSYIANEQYMNGTKDNVVILVDNENSNTPYELKNEYRGGIVIATGDVRVDGGFDGIIISGGTISFAGGAVVNADESKVVELIKEDLSRADKKFSGIINDSVYMNSNEIGAIENKDYIYYDNWTKN